MTAIFWGFLLRFGQVVLEAALTLLIGVVVAGVLRRMIGPAGTRKLFGRGWKGLFRGWLAGMLLPVCSLGVIPVAREMRRAGVPAGTVLAFVLAAPLLNPISFLYGLTLAEPSTILWFAFASLILSTLAGYLWDRLFAPTDDHAVTEELARLADAHPLPTAGPKRILSVLVSAMTELAGKDRLYYAIGLVGSALLAAVIPFASLQGTMHHNDPISPLLMGAVSIPIFSSPLPGMMKIGLMFEHGNSIGAAFVLFVLGIGTSVGTLVWLVTDFGKRILLWFATYVALILAMAYAAEWLIYQPGKEVANHTHAFDDYSCPFPFGDGSQHGQATLAKLEEKFGPLERPAVYTLVAFLVVGSVLRRRHDSVERWLTTTPESGPIARPKWDLIVPGPVLGVIALLGLVVFSVVGAYLFYPDRAYCLDRMFALYADTRLSVMQSKKEEAIRHLELWDDLTRKLQVGVYIREFSLTEEQSHSADELREALEEVRDEFLADQPKEAITIFKEKVEPMYRACREAYSKK
jgi:uncharacterized membrane protein YraQ (UPF0718 family)